MESGIRNFVSSFFSMIAFYLVYYLWLICAYIRVFSCVHIDLTSLNNACAFGIHVTGSAGEPSGERTQVARASLPVAKMVSRPRAGRCVVSFILNYTVDLIPRPRLRNLWRQLIMVAAKALCCDTTTLVLSRPRSGNAGVGVVRCAICVLATQFKPCTRSM